MLASSPACRRTARSIGSGSEWHWPRQSLQPVVSTTQIDVSFCETSKPTKQAIEHLPCVNCRARCPDRGSMSGTGSQPRLPDVHTCTNARLISNPPDLAVKQAHMAAVRPLSLHYGVPDSLV